MNIFGVNVNIDESTDTRELIEFFDEIADSFNTELANEIGEDEAFEFHVSEAESGGIDEALEAIKSCNDLQGGSEKFSEEFLEELNDFKEFSEFLSELSASPDFEYGETVIRDDYGKEYAEELCKEVGYLPDNLPWWISNHIDWEGVWDEMQMDYFSAEFDGYDYWIRA